MNTINQRAAHCRIVLLALIPLTSACASQLDSSQEPVVRQAGAFAGEPVATVFGEPVAATDEILGLLLERYRQEKGIVATAEEMQRFEERMAEFMRKSSMSKFMEESGSPGEQQRGVDAKIAEHSVLQWKSNKALHDQYGGVVIFQQANPMEPVGAYLAFLREEESKGSFQIHDPAIATEFWSYFTADHGTWVVDPEEVDYSKPWWETVSTGD